MVIAAKRTNLALMWSVLIGITAGIVIALFVSRSNIRSNVKVKPIEWQSDSSWVKSW